MTTRRGFLTSILALSAAPAIVRAESLMRIVVPSREIAVPTLAETVAVNSASRLFTTETLTREALKILRSNLDFTKAINAAYQMPIGSGTIKIRTHADP